MTMPIPTDWIVDGPTTLHGYDDDLVYMLVRTDTDDPELERQIALVSTWDIEGERYAQMIAAVPKLLAACQAVVDRWERGDLAEAARMCSTAIETALGERTMSEYRHRYPAKCPKCGTDLTADSAVVIHFLVAGQQGETRSRLDRDGWLVDAERVVAGGFHSGTDCRSCGKRLDDHEILDDSVTKRKKEAKPSKSRRVEYYRLWGGDSGTWDTDYIDIPADTPDDMLDKAIRQAAGKIKWQDEAPVIVGLYCNDCDDPSHD